MASVDFYEYSIDYSILDGTIRSFEKQNETGEYVPVTENYKEELIKAANDLIELQSNEHHPGYSAFLYKLAREGTVKLPKKGEA